MKYGWYEAPVSNNLPLGPEINRAASDCQFPSPVIYAIAYRETLSSLSAELAAKCISGDGGHGLCQLTSSYPNDWYNPTVNATYAIKQFLVPAVNYWHGLHGYEGDTLLKLVAATYNEGLGAAQHYHEQGDVDAGTTNHYGQGVVDIYHNLTTKGTPA